MRRMGLYEGSSTVKRTVSNAASVSVQGRATDHDLPEASGWNGKRKTSLGGYSESASKITTSQSILNLVNCILGAGVLGYPFCFKACGFVLGTLMMLVTLAATRISYQLLLYCSQLSGRRTYESIAEQSLGRKGRLVLELCTAALNLGCIVAYLNILADILSSVAGTIIPPGAEPSRSAYLTGVTILGALPVGIFVRDHAVVAALSTASVGCVLLFAAVIVVLAVTPPAAGLAAAAAVDGTSKLLLWQPDGLLVAFPVMAYGFTAHPYYLGIYAMLPSPNIRRMGRVTDLALGVCAGVYWVVGVGGYALFKQRVAGDVLRNFGGAASVGLRGAYERALKLCYGLAILGSVPLVILPFYTIIMPLLTSRQQPSSSSRHHSSSGGSFTEKGGSQDVLGPLLKDRSSTPGQDKAYEALHHHTRPQDAHFHTPQADLAPSFAQHTLAVVLVLGLSMASALWLPNVEFIFGLTGSTATVIIGFVLPAVCFLKLYWATPELSGSNSSSAMWLVVPQELKNTWRLRQWLAVILLIFGIVSSVLCTRAILGGINEEKAVVQMAQEIAEHEAVAVEATRAQQKAKEAAVAVGAVERAAKELVEMQDSTNNTLGALEAAAAALNTIANSSSNASEHHSIFNIQERLHEHKEKVREEGVLMRIEYALGSAQEDINTTVASVTRFVVRLDGSIKQIKDEAAAAGGAQSGTGSPSSSSRASMREGDGPEAATGAAGEEPGNIGSIIAQQQQLTTHSSSSVVPHDGRMAGTSAPALLGGGGGAAAQGGSSSSSSTESPWQQQQVTPVDRATEMAKELSKALGVHWTAAGRMDAGKSLEQVRDAALSALSALSTTTHVLQQVQEAVAVARKAHKRDAQVKEAAVQAMQRALNATSASHTAMKMTGEALSNAATEETHELLVALKRVAQDMQKGGMRSKNFGSSAVVKVTSEAGEGAMPAAGHQGGGGGAAAAAAAKSAGAAAVGGTPVGSEGLVGFAGNGRGQAAGAAGVENAQAKQQQEKSAALHGGGSGGAALPPPLGATVSSSTAAAAGSKGSEVAARPSGVGSSGDIAGGLPGAAGGADGRVTPSASYSEAASTGASTASGVAVDGGSVAEPNKTATSTAKTSSSSSALPGLTTIGGEGAAAAAVAAAAAGASVESGAGAPSSSANPAGSSGGKAQGRLPSSSLTTDQVMHINQIISKLADVLAGNSTSGAPGSSSGSTGTNVTMLVTAIQDALVWAQGSREAVMDMIEATLGKTDSKVASRVVGIVKDIRLEEAAAKGKEQKDQQEQHQQQELADPEIAGQAPEVQRRQDEAVNAGVPSTVEQQQQHQDGLVAASAGGVGGLHQGSSREAEARVVADGGSTIGAQTGGGNAIGSVGQGDKGPVGLGGGQREKVEGPVVRVTPKEMLEQSDVDGITEGPVVEQREHVATKGVGEAAQGNPPAPVVGVDALAADEAQQESGERINHAIVVEQGGKGGTGKNGVGTRGPVVKVAEGGQLTQMEEDAKGPVVETGKKDEGEAPARSGASAEMPPALSGSTTRRLGVWSH